MAKPKSYIPSLSDLGAMWQASGLKEKLLFTIMMVCVYRFGVQVPIWGVDASAVQKIASGGLIGFLDMFSGGALGNVSVLALGIGPYITASIIMQLLTVVIPRLEEMQKEEGEAGRKKIAQYTRYFAVVLSLFQGAMVMRFIASIPGAVSPDVDMNFFWVCAVLSLTAGAMFALWTAEMITDRGIGNGGSLLIFIGILAGLPLYASNTYLLVANDPQKSFNLIALLLIYMVTIGLIIILQEASRQVFVVGSKRQVGNKMYGGQNTYIPFKINPAGVMPIIFTFAVLAFPSTIIGLVGRGATGSMQEFVMFYTRYLGPGTWAYIFIEFAMIIFFTFFYASIIPSMQPKQIAENLKKYGSAIPGVKPGKPTADKLEEILSKTIWIGAIALGVITLIASGATQITDMRTLQGLGSTSLIIMVGVALDTMNQIRVHLLSRQYEGFLK